MRILIAEDNGSLASAITRALAADGHAVDWIPDGLEADEFLASTGADLVILDLNLPRMSGFEIVRALRRRDDPTPVLILTARSDGADRVAGLDAGADDYLVKPFDMDELMARLRALDRRRARLAPRIEREGLIEYDRQTRSLVVAGAEIALSRRERALFEVLFAQSGRVVSKNSIAEALYGIGSEVDRNAVEIAVSRLRRLLAGTGVEIRTVRGLGYMLNPGTPPRVPPAPRDGTGAGDA